MYKVKNGTFSLNFFAGILLLMMLKVVLNISSLEYIVLAIALCGCIYGVATSCISTDTIKIILAFSSYILIQIWGLKDNFCLYGIKSIIASTLVCVFVVFCIEFMPTYSPKPIFMVYYFFIGMIFFRLIIKGRTSFSKQNTLAGNILFWFVIFSICYLSASKPKEVVRRHRKKKVLSGTQWIVLAINGALCIALIFLTESRTALLVGGVIFVSFVFLMIFNPSEKTVKYMFWILILAMFVVMIFYINIQSFDWYEKVNSYSKEMFQKNLDSSRPYLWSTELHRVGRRWLVGVGTGALPSIKRYANSSFHNIFIQLFVQNGIIAVVSILAVFYMLWKKLSGYAYDLTIKLVLASFIGIMFYNCFEETMLSNKIALGILQWIILCMGIKEAKRIEEEVKDT